MTNHSTFSGGALNLTQAFKDDITLTSSSDYDSSRFDVSELIDGDTNSGFAHTGRGAHEYFELDFGQTVAATEIKITNRGDRVGERLNGAEIVAYDANGIEVYRSAPISGAYDGSVHSFALPNGLEASSFRIEHTNQYLHITEFQVIGYPSTSGDDNITGDGSSQVINGLDGNDNIDASAGNDTVYGGDGNDTITGGSGADSVYAGAGNDEVTIALNGGVNEFADGGTGNDTLKLVHKDGADIFFDMESGGIGDGLPGGQTAINFENVVTGNGNDEVHGSEGANVIDASAGNDTVYGGDGNDTITGGSGADSVDAGAGDDEVTIALKGGVNEFADGGTGNDTLKLVHKDGADITFDMESGGIGDGLPGGQTAINFENVVTADGNDTVIVDAAANVVETKDGNDTLKVTSAAKGAGDTFIAGGTDGSDNDVLDLRGAGSAIVIQRDDADDAGATEGTVTFADGSTMTFEGVEKVVADKSAAVIHVDDLAASVGKDQDHVGGAGNDVIYGDGANAQVVTEERESFNWNQISSQQIDDARSTPYVQDSGKVTVTFTRPSDNTSHDADVQGNKINVSGIDSGAEVINNSSSLGSTNTSKDGFGQFQWEFSEEVSDVSFRIADIDGGSIVAVRAFDAAGNPLVVDYDLGAQLRASESDGVAGAETIKVIGSGQEHPTDSANSALVSIAGPVAKLVIDHDINAAFSASGIQVSDLFYGVPTKPTVVAREVFEWSEVTPGQEEGTFTQDTGLTKVTFTRGESNGVQAFDPLTDVEIFTGGIVGDGDPINATSSGGFFGGGGGGTNGNTKINLAFDNPVENVTFNIADIDGSSTVRVLAFDANGNAINVDLAAQSNMTLVDSDGQFGADAAFDRDLDTDASEADGTITVTVPGPVSSIEVYHSGVGGLGANISDVYFDPTVGVDTGADDSIIGGAGADTMYGQDGNDLFKIESASDGRGDKVIGGGDKNDASDIDILDMRGSGNVHVNYSKDSSDANAFAGQAVFAEDGGNLEFKQVELILSDDEMISSLMLHGADGIYTFEGTSYYFQDKAADGSYRYGKEWLENDNKASYDLSKNDLDFLLEQAKLGVVEKSDLADISEAIGIRELSGFGNNVENPLWGTADQLFKRLTEADYKDGIGAVRDGPNPRDISNIVLNQNKDDNPNLFGPNAGAQDKNLENNFRANEFTWAFGQYFDHGLDFLPKGGVNSDGTAAGVLYPGNDSFPLTLTRGSVAEGTGIDSPREHVNQTSPYVDQNQAYGSNDKIMEFLLERDADGRFTGRLLSGEDTDVPTLGEAKANWQLGVDAGLAEAIDWDDPTTLSNFRGSGDALLLDINPFIPIDQHLVAGDGRVNENAALSVVHTIWKNNHNFWVDKLIDIFHEQQNGHAGVPVPPDLGPVMPDGMTAEHIFHMAKIINEAEYQRAAFDEFVELLVGSDVHAWKDYNPNINADITHEFAAAAYRLGHSMLNNTVTVAKDDGSHYDVPLFDLFLNPIKFKDLGAANLMEGMASSLQQEIDSKIVTTMRNNLLGRPLDLAAFNIDRGRDVGLPTLNDMREMSGLSRYSSWEEFGHNLRYASDLEKFKQAYDTVDDIDLWVGGLAEKPSSSDAFGTKLAQNSVMGETFAQVFAIQMIAVQDGDRFYYKHRLLETELLLNIQGQDFSEIVERTLGLEYLQASILETVDNRLDFRDVDYTKLELVGTDGHDVIIGRKIGETIKGKDGGDTMYLEAGNDTGYGGDGDDAIFGDAGDDHIYGESGDDRADGGTGNDVIYGGHGDDDLSGNEGNDTIYGEENDDEIQGGDGSDHLEGNDGDDMVAGGLSNDSVFGGSGNDRVNGNDGNDVVDGGSGKDDVYGGRGNDKLTGGSEGDTFHFLPDSGHDVITDFNAGEDRIDLHRYVWEFGEGAVNISTIYAATVDTSGGAKMGLADGSTILFAGVSKGALFATSSKTFVFEDKVYGREGLILDKQTGIVVDAGTRKEVIEDELTGEVTIIEPQDREDYVVWAASLEKTGFTVGASDAGVVTYVENYEHGASGWSFGRTAKQSNGNDYLGNHGGYGSHTAHMPEAKSFALQENTEKVVLEFDFLEIDSWDNERFFIEIDGKQVNLGSFNWRANEGATSFDVGDGITVEKGAAVKTVQTRNATDFWAHNDSLHTFKITLDNPDFRNADGKLDLKFGAALSGGSWEESWGVDNLRITEFDSAVSLAPSVDTGKLTYVHEGEDGGYDIQINGADLANGDASVEVLLNGDEMLFHTLDGSHGLGDVTYTAENLFIKKGDIVELVAYGDGDDHVWIDDLTFVAINDPYETLFV